MSTDGEKDQKVLQLIWQAFLGSLGLYAAVVFLVTDGQAATSELVATLRPVFFVAAAGLAVAGFVLRRQIVAALSPSTSALPAADIAQRVRVGCLVTWALSEAVAILGLVLAVLSHQPAEFVPFVAVAAVLLYVHRPAVWPTAGSAGLS